MSISVVTVALNAGRDLPLTIESVLQQDYPDTEHIVVDGGSWDDTPAILNRYKGYVDKTVRVEDAGIYFAMNMALDHCTGSHVIFLNAGDRFYSANVLSKVTAMLQGDPDIFFGDHIYVDRGRETLTRAADYGLTMRQLRTGRIDHRWLSQLPGHQATFVRVDLLRRLRFNTAIEICADHDVLARAYAAGARMQYVDQTVSHYVGGGLSSQRSGRLMLEWSSLYREYTDRPEAVDLFFLGSTPSPFGAQNRRGGSYLAGSFGRETCAEHGIEEPVHWCAADGFQLRTAEGVASDGLTLNGFNPFDRQRLALFVDGHLVGSEPVGKGWFTQVFRLTQPLAGGVAVDVAPTRGGPISASDRRLVGVALSWFAFRTLEDGQTILRAGTRMAFTSANAQETASMLGGGWSAQEAEHIWSVGDAAQIALRVEPDASQVILVLRGNPFLQDDGKRGVDVDVNGQRVSRTLLGVGNTRVEVDCTGELWQQGRTNSIVLRPLATKSSPNDSRALGSASTRSSAVEIGRRPGRFTPSPSPPYLAGVPGGLDGAHGSLRSFLRSTRIGIRSMTERIWVAGHRGMVGSAIVRQLRQQGRSVVTASRTELDLRNQQDVERWVREVQPTSVIFAAAKVGGIYANNAEPATFLYDNICLQTNAIHAAHLAGVNRFVFLGSSCIYPKFAEQPIREDSLLTGSLEPTNEWYAIAKIAGIKLCQAYMRQYGRQYNSVMPCNLYGPGDNFDLTTSHVLPATIRKLIAARNAGDPSVNIWGTGSPLREFLHVDDLAAGVVHCHDNYFDYEHINCGSSEEVTIKGLAELVAEVVGYEGELRFDPTKPDGTPRKVMDSTRLREMGWRPKVSLFEGIRTTVQWFENHHALA